MTKKLKEIYSQSLINVDDNNVSKMDIEYLIKETFSLSHVDFILKQDETFDDDLLISRINELKEGKPVEYLIGYTDFCSLRFEVNENTLIPRSETEDLIYRTLEYIKRYNISCNKILDIGSGSGCIAISLNKMIINSNVTSVDISSKALEVSNRNNIKNGTNVKFVLSDCFENIEGRFDLIISNPPYIDKDTYVQESVLKYEPHTALFAENKGLAIYEKIISNVSNYINRPSLVAFEISPDLVNRLEKLIKDNLNDVEYFFEKDLNNFERFLFIKFN